MWDNCYQFIDDGQTCQMQTNFWNVKYVTINFGSFPPMNVDGIINHFYINRLTVPQNLLYSIFYYKLRLLKKKKLRDWGFFRILHHDNIFRYQPYSNTVIHFTQKLLIFSAILILRYTLFWGQWILIDFEIWIFKWW